MNLNYESNESQKKCPISIKIPIIKIFYVCGRETIHLNTNEHEHPCMSNKYFG